MDRGLHRSAWIYAAGLALHTLDHLRRGTDVVTPHVMGAGAVGTSIAALAIVLVLRRDRVAPAVAAIAGLGNGVGVAVVHLLPRWGAFSDPFVGAAAAAGVTPMSWAALVLEVTGALWMGSAGAAIMLERRSARVG